MEGATERVRGARGGAREEGNFKGRTMRRTLASIQFTVHKTTHNMAPALDTLVLQMKTSEQVGLCKLCIEMRRNVLFDR